MNDHDHTHQTGANNISSFISGAVLGAALLYLLGTKDGKKLKDQLIKEGQKVLEEMGQELKEASEKIEGNAAKKLEAVKEEVEDAIGEVPEHIQEIQKKGRRFFFKRSRSRSES